MQANQASDIEARILEARRGLIKPHRSVQVALASPPPTPACWTSDLDWLDWIALSYSAGLPITRRKDTGKYRGEREVTLVTRRDLDYCSGCSASFKAQMKREGRCNPSQAELARERAEVNEQPAVTA